MALMLVIMLIVISSAHSTAESCNRYVLGSTGVQTLSSPTYPFAYHHYSLCKLRIYLAHLGDDPKQICFQFRRFDLEIGRVCGPRDHLTLGPYTYCGKGRLTFSQWDVSAGYRSVWNDSLCLPAPGSNFTVTFKTDQSIARMGFYANYFIKLSTAASPSACNISYACPPSGVSQDETGTCFCGDNNDTDSAPCGDGLFTCFNRKCINERWKCNGMDDCGDNSDEQYAHAMCTSYDRRDYSACAFGQGDCTWRREGWERQKIQRNKYSPEGDHTFAPLTGIPEGYYMSADIHARPPLLLTSRLPKTVFSSLCLTFWYYMYSPSLRDSLSVYNTINKVSRLLWQRVGNRGPRWIMGEVEIAAPRSIYSEIQFRAEYDHMSYSGHEIALDDISILEGRCHGGDVSCTFDVSACGWSHSLPNFMNDDKRNYTLRFNWERNERIGGYMKAISQYDGGTALLVSPAVSDIYTGSCLSFQYLNIFSNGNPFTKLVVSPQIKVSIIQHGHSPISIKYMDNLQNGSWIKESIFIGETNLPYMIMFEVEFPSNVHATLSIDDVRLTDGRCPEILNRVLTTTTNPCPSRGWFRCSNNNCVWLSDICNGRDDCGDSSDEHARFKCRTSESFTTSSIQPVCRTYDELFQEKPYLCQNGCLIRQELKCNGVDDCRDNSDEQQEFAECTDKLFRSPPNKTIMGVVIAMAVIVVLVVLAVFSFNVCKRRLAIAERLNRYRVRQQTINGNAQSSTNDSPVEGIDFAISADSPPAYSVCVGDPPLVIGGQMGAPPSYDSIFKDASSGSFPGETLSVPEYNQAVANSVHVENEHLQNHARECTSSVSQPNPSFASDRAGETSQTAVAETPL